MRERILKTAFYTALFSYLVFAVVEYAVPGFVSYVFSVHLIGLFAVVLGMAWGIHAKRGNSRLAGAGIAVALGAVLLVVVWREGEAFGDVRLPLALAALVLPWLSYRLLSVDEK